VETDVWVDVVDVIVGIGEWVVATGFVGWGSSGGGPRRLRRCLCSLIFLGVMGVGVATLFFFYKSPIHCHKGEVTDCAAGRIEYRVSLLPKIVNLPYFGRLIHCMFSIVMVRRLVCL